MKIRMNDFTSAKIKESIGANGGSLRLFYDTEDCGCNGVLVLQLLDQPHATDLLVEESPFPVFLDRQQESLFDDVMIIEADPEFPVFKVASEGSLFNRNVPMKDLRSS